MNTTGKTYGRKEEEESSTKSKVLKILILLKNILIEGAKEQNNCRV